MKLTFTVLLLVAAVYHANAANIVICEGGSNRISCPTGYIINVLHAFYGRTDGTTCPHPSILTTSCTAAGSSNIINDVCDGQQYCSLSANNQVFGDPCPGTYKYIKVEYKCTRPCYPVPFVKVICEHSTGTINCGTGKRIGVLDAFYGRSNRLTCPSRSILTTSCSAPNSFNQIRSSCHGNQACTLSANNGVYGDPCVGTYKYIKVKYVCYYP
uniref:L-rhamnose-binding lectin SML isoform X1 n=1 Tax=Ciona intestinalis TaxID=7719 RepID=UPI000EF49957|nr:L-rhamnose-binding lectin SML isoform X1 [Ciona intestinalis]|eukprot:XP_026692634.1 L-rhamnose-binding lectin SML isoform X1 [Ciona intestinalis]